MTFVRLFCTSSHTTVTTVSHVATRNSFTPTGYNAIDEEAKPVCIRRHFAYAFWLFWDFSDQCEDMSLYDAHFRLVVWLLLLCHSLKCEISQERQYGVVPKRHCNPGVSQGRSFAIRLKRKVSENSFEWCLEKEISMYEYEHQTNLAWWNVVWTRNRSLERKTCNLQW